MYIFDGRSAGFSVLVCPVLPPVRRNKKYRVYFTDCSSTLDSGVWSTPVQKFVPGSGTGVMVRYILSYEYVHTCTQRTPPLNSR